MLQRMRNDATYPKSIESVIALCIAMHFRPEYSAKLIEKSGFSLRIADNEAHLLYKFFLNEYYMHTIDDCNAILTAKGFPNRNLLRGIEYMTPAEFKKKYLSNLNKQQCEAVQTVDGAILLLAVPGSGKTTVLVTRLGYMIYCRSIAPDSILTMTYTVAATKEMQQRFASMFGSEYADALEFRTINGLSAKIIDYYSRNYGKRQPFKLLDNDSELSRLVGQIY